MARAHNSTILQIREKCPEKCAQCTRKCEIAEKEKPGLGNRDMKYVDPTDRIDISHS